MTPDCYAYYHLHDRISCGRTEGIILGIDSRGYRVMWDDQFFDSFYAIDDVGKARERNARKPATLNTVAKERAGQQDVNSDCLFGSFL